MKRGVGSLKTRVGSKTGVVKLITRNVVYGVQGDVLNGHISTMCYELGKIWFEVLIKLFNIMCISYY
ncbi:hypothetical protein ACU8V7_03465 [Zobellia nedashkovskayae]